MNWSKLFNKASMGLQSADSYCNFPPKGFWMLLLWFLCYLTSIELWKCISNSELLFKMHRLLVLH